MQMMVNSWKDKTESKLAENRGLQSIGPALNSSVGFLTTLENRPVTRQATWSEIHSVNGPETVPVTGDMIESKAQKRSLPSFCKYHII
jgi:hypothetical protein